MKNKIIEKRYAEAFLGFAKNTFGQDRAVEELKQLKIILFENPLLREFLDNTEIIYAEKCAVMDDAFKAFSEETREFLKLLLEKGRIKNILGICDYVRINYSSGEALEALLKTSYPLDLDVIQNIKDSVEGNLKRKLDLHIELDPDLLGGAQIKVGNTLMDGSVKKRLEELREKLMGASLY